MWKNIWEFFQNEVLGMKWLSRIIENGLKAAGLDTGSRVGGSIHFFIYDTIKINPKLFSAGKNKENTRKI